MFRARSIACGLAALGLGGCQPAAPPVEVLSEPAKIAEAPAMCPWRDPTGDMRRFFPDADAYVQESLILSSVRLEILRRLGPDTPLESNALYLYRVRRGKEERGTVLVRRAAGEFGAIEVVVAIDRSQHVVGVRLQRHREPPEVAAVLESPKWLGEFHGKAASDPLEIGNGLPNVPATARKSAAAIARAVRSLLIEYAVAEMHHRGNHHAT
jgi:hypothetical protein